MRYQYLRTAQYPAKTAQFQTGPAAIAVCKLYSVFIHKNITPVYRLSATEYIFCRPGGTGQSQGVFPGAGRR